MHWRFDPLFSIAVYHSKYKDSDPETGEVPRKAPDFVLEPSKRSEALLSGIGWIFKQRSGSCIIYGEKVFSADGSKKLRGLPDQATGFTFLLRLPNGSILNETRPYVLDGQPNKGLPLIVGRSRLLYFDNLNPTSGSGGELWLTRDPMDLAQFGSSAPVPFDFMHPDSKATSVDFTPLIPGGKPQKIALNTQTRTTEINLPENGYRIAPLPDEYSKILFLSPENITADTLGVVRIFEPPGGWEPLHRYQILFDKA